MSSLRTPLDGHIDVSASLVIVLDEMLATGTIDATSVGILLITAAYLQFRSRGICTRPQ